MSSRLASLVISNMYFVAPLVFHFYQTFNQTSMTINHIVDSMKLHHMYVTWKMLDARIIKKHPTSQNLWFNS